MEKLRWGVEQRLEFIEYRLFWEGSVNRSDITARFSVSVPQASKDLAQYQETAPDSLSYDRRAKCYVPTESYQPIYFEPDAESFLAKLVDRTGASADLLAAIDYPKADIIPELGRALDPSLVRHLTLASRERHAVEILYQSMNPKRSEPVWRKISPHGFGNDGMRWHVRAHCHIDGAFKDFLISRCMDIRAAGPSDVDPATDRHWHETLTVRLIPNPALSENQRRVIAADYDMKDGTLSVQVRRSFLFYFLRRYRLDLAELSADPRETPIIIDNRAEFDQALADMAG